MENCIDKDLWISTVEDATAEPITVEKLDEFMKFILERGISNEHC